MGRCRYIGSKARVVTQIMECVGHPSRCGRFLDVFSGTGVVSREALLRGWSVKANDHLISSATMTTARLLSEEHVPFTGFRGYAEALRHLNQAKPVEGFIFREYSPSGRARSGHPRPYFTSANAARIDSVRQVIRTWRENAAITGLEESLLIADLLQASNAVASIAGTYGCFMRSWTPNALRPLFLKPRRLLKGLRDFEVSAEDAFDIAAQREDLAYLDPPYTKRQYAAYYHVLETITVGDEPEVGGVTGLRPWEHKASPFCYKRKARNALWELVNNLRACRVCVSYNSDGHISIEAIRNDLSAIGDVRVHILGTIRRYRPNRAATNKLSSVTEYLVDLVKD